MSIEKGDVKILAGDIGGTKTVLGLFRSKGKELAKIREEIFPSREYAGLDKIIRKFLPVRDPSIQSACFGVAGPVFENACKTTNLPWIVDAKDMSLEFGIASVVLLNDLEATAYGSLHLSEKEYCILNPGQVRPQGNRCIIAAGTGLGEAVLFWDGFKFRPSATEGGHTDFAPRNSIEMNLLQYLMNRFPRVSNERVLSGPGILNIYQFLKDANPGEEPSWLSEQFGKEDPSALISRLALEKKSELCVKTLDLFVTLYGAEAGNLALKVMATGGVYIGGGIGDKILTKLLDGAFMKAFNDKGRFASFMNRIPVRVILNEKTALLGAAHYAGQLEEK